MRLPSPSGQTSTDILSAADLESSSTTMASPSIPTINLLPFIGPQILAYLASYCLYGILIVQMCVYSITFAHDRRALKAFVWLVFLTETLFMIFLSIGAWNFGAGWGDINTVLVLDWSFIPLVPLITLLAIMVQSFYAWRIRCLSGRLFLPLAICCIALVGGGFLLYISVIFAFTRSVQTFAEFDPEVSTGLAGTAACDIIITVSLVILLSHRKQKGLKETTSLINRLVRFNIETGFLTSITALVDLVLFYAVPGSTWHTMVFYILGGFYCNTFLATLNYRAWISGDQTVVSSTSVPTVFWSDHCPPRAGASSSSLSSLVCDYELREFDSGLDVVSENDRGGVTHAEQS